MLVHWAADLKLVTRYTGRGRYLMAWGKLISLRYHGQVRRKMFIALSGGVTEIPTSVDDTSALFHSNFQISHLSLFLIQMLHIADTSFSFLCFTSFFNGKLPLKYSYFIQIASDTFFSFYSCSFCDPAFNLILNHDHNLARTSEVTFTKWEKELPKPFLPLLHLLEYYWKYQIRFISP